MTLDEFMASLPPAYNLRAGYVDRAVIAKTIRADCARALACGVLPSGTQVSVRKASGRGSSSITAEIVRWEGAVFSKAYEESLMGGDEWEPEKHRRWDTTRGSYVDGRLSDALHSALWTLERIADRHNYDNSDLMTDYHDVGYYLTVEASTVESAARLGIRMQHDKALIALHARAHAAAQAVGPRVVASVLGKRGLETASEYCMERLVRLAERANGRPLTYDKRRGWTVVAKRDESDDEDHTGHGGTCGLAACTLAAERDSRQQKESP